MKRMKGRLLTALLSIAMVFTMIPMMGAPAYADDPAPPAIYLVDRRSLPKITGEQKSSIYFGHYPQSEADSVEGLTEDVDYIKVGDKNYLIEPIKWRVLGNPIDSVGQPLPDLILLSEKNLDWKKYNEVFTGITWEHSTIRAWLNGTLTNGGTPCRDEDGVSWDVQTFDYGDDSFIGAAFSSDEKKAIREDGVRNEKSNSYTPNPYYPTMEGGNNTVDKIFLLSINDAQNVGYGFTDNRNSTEKRQAKNTAYAKAQGAPPSIADNGNWWLRSPGSKDGRAAIISNVGTVESGGPPVLRNYGVRPACVLQSGVVIFTSAAAGGKSSGDVGAGSLKEVGTNETNEWKLTLEGGHDNFEVENVSTCDGKTVIIEYSGAVAAKGEYISAIITDENDAVKYYGNLIKFDDGDSTSGTAKVTIEGKMGPTDKLYVFNEKLNEDKKTDYASKLIEITVPATAEHNYVWESMNDEKHWHECTVCHEKKDEAAHTWDAGKVTKAATEQAEGVKTYTCTVCKATKTESIPKLTPSTPKTSGTPTSKMSAGKTSITMAWRKIQGADGYDIFFAECNHGGKKIVCKNVKTIEGNNIFTWTNSGLKKGTAYKSYVKAFVMKNGRKVYVSTSPVMHAYTGNGNKKYTNAKSVTIRNVKKGKLSLKKNKTFKIKAKVNKVNKGKKLMPKGHAPTLRYMTSDSKVATVNSKGKITAKSSGTCYIYVYAHNGVSKTIKVTVK